MRSLAEISCLLILLILNHTDIVSANECQSGWFGSRCQYKCHCDSDRCQPSGECQTGHRCQPTWFGPACQYKDAAPDSDAPAWMSDDNDTTCNPGNANRTMLTINNLLVVVTWLRLVVHKTQYIDDFNVGLHYTRTGVVWEDCLLRASFVVSETTYDIHCRNRRVVDALQLTGEGVAWLCSLYVSGGRNIALRQSGQLSRPWADHLRNASTALDGVTGQGPHSPCTLTTFEDLQTTLTVQLNAPYDITSYQLYNQVDCCSPRLRAFTLTTYHPDSNSTTTYQHQDIQYNHAMYTVFLPSTTPVTRVTITETYGYPVVQNLCELEIYGDQACLAGKYGLDCGGTCNCGDQQVCFVSTGGCAGGCPLGLAFEGCVRKDPCRGMCRARICSNEGHCYKGCSPGYWGELCSLPCPAGTWGLNCSQDCPRNCLRETSCDSVTGKCSVCRAGYRGRSCTMFCPQGKHGINCSAHCSANCLHRQCDPLAGHCKNCQPGRMGLFCGLAIEETDMALSFAPLILLATSTAATCLFMIFHTLCTRRSRREFTAVTPPDSQHRSSSSRAMASQQPKVPPKCDIPTIIVTEPSS